MDFDTDIYKTLADPSPEILYKDRKSKFFGYAFPIKEQEEIKPILDTLRKRHPSANHICYAWQLGVEQKTSRTNDDGEPNNSAGLPIYGQIQAFGLTSVLVVVARIFGGTKLGVGGLISAYKTTARLALEAARIEERYLEVYFILKFDYHLMDKIMRIIKRHDLGIVTQKMNLDCHLTTTVRKKDMDGVARELDSIPGLKWLLCSG